MPRTQSVHVKVTERQNVESAEWRTNCIYEKVILIHSKILSTDSYNVITFFLYQQQTTASVNSDTLNFLTSLFKKKKIKKNLNQFQLATEKPLQPVIKAHFYGQESNDSLPKMTQTNLILGVVITLHFSYSCSSLSSLFICYSTVGKKKLL